MLSLRSFVWERYGALWGVCGPVIAFQLYIYRDSQQSVFLVMCHNRGDFRVCVLEIVR